LLTLGLCDEDGEVLALGLELSDTLADALIDTLSLGDKDALGVLSVMVHCG